MTIARRPRSVLLGAVLALAAMLGFAALSGWHSAAIHNDDPGHVTSLEHSHEQADHDKHEDHDDPDGPIHLAAHANGQGLALAGQAVAPFSSAPIENAWLSFDSPLKGGIDPSELLRPPRG